MDINQIVKYSESSIESGTPAVLSVEEIKKEIITAQDTKKSEESIIASAVNSTNAIAEEASNSVDSLISSMFSATNLEQVALEESGNLEKAKVDAYIENLGETNQFVDKQIENQNRLLALQDNNMDKLEEIDRRRRGVKLDESGEEVKMGVAEKTLSFITHNMLEYDHTKTARITEENARISSEVKNSQIAISNKLQNQASRVETSFAYQVAKKTAIDATSLANVAKLDTANKQQVYNTLAKDYELNESKVNNLIKVAELVDEAQRPQQLMQLMQLQQESRRMSLAYGQADKDNKLIEAWQSYITNAAEVVGTDTKSQKFQDETLILANALKSGNWDIVQVLKKNPTLWATINAMDSNSTLTDVVMLQDKAFASAMTSSDDPDAKLAGETYLRFASVAEQQLESDPAILKGIREQADRLFGIMNADSKEYKQYVASETESYVEGFAKNQMAAYSNNSIDQDRRAGALKPVASSQLANTYAQKAKHGELVLSEEIKAATTMGKILDKNIDSVEDGIGDVIKEFTKTFAPVKDKESTLKQRTAYAKGMAEAFNALQEANDLTSRDNILYKPSSEWILQDPVKGFKAYDMQGKDLTDPNTFLFLLNGIHAQETALKLKGVSGFY